MKLRRVVLISIFILSIPGYAHPSNFSSEKLKKCRELVQPSLANLDLKNAEKLSDRAVFKVFDKKTHQYSVIRFQSKNDDMGHWGDEENIASNIAFEGFATKLASKIGHLVKVEPVHIVSKEAAENLYSVLNENPSWKTGLEKHAEPIASITPFVASDKAKTVFPRYFLERPFQSFFEMLSEVAREEGDPNSINAIPHLFFNPDNKEGMHKLSLLLEKIFPGHRFETPQEIEKIFFSNNPLIRTNADIERCYEVIFSELPDTYVDAAAEYWATGNILGIPDLDAENALWDGKKIIGIDLSYPGRRFKAGYQSPGNGEAQAVALDPTGDFGMTYNPVMGAFLMKRLKPEYLKKLEKITPEKITEIAHESGLALKSFQLRGVHSRIRRFERRELGTGEKENFKFDE